MKKFIAFIVLVALILGGKCYYQKSKVNSFLEALKEYGYGYKVKNSSLCSMDIALKIEDVKKLFNIYPKFVRDSKVFKEAILKDINGTNISVDEQDYHITLPIFGFSVVATNTYKIKNSKMQGSFAKFMRHLSDKGLIKSTTTCNILTNKCVSVYNDIKTTYEGRDFVVKGIISNAVFKGKRAMVGDMRVKKVFMKDKATEFELEDLKIDFLYNDEDKFAIKEIVNAKVLRIKDKQGLDGKFSNIVFGGAYNQDGKSFFKLSADSFRLPDNNLDIDMKKFTFYLDISDKSGYEFNIDSFDFKDKKKSINLHLSALDSKYKFLDNNPYIAKGSTKIGVIDFKHPQEGEFKLKNLNFVSSPSINKDILNLSENYTIDLISLNSKMAKFKLNSAAFNIEVKDIGYSVLRDMYNEMKEVYKEAFWAGFNGDAEAAAQINRKIRSITGRYMPRFAEILQYGIKINLKKLGFKELIVNGKTAKDLDAKLYVELKKITINDIMGKKYDKNNLPIKSLKGEIIIPNALFDITHTPVNAVPFKLEDKGEFKVINLSFKDGKVFINKEPLK